MGQDENCAIETNTITRPCSVVWIKMPQDFILCKGFILIGLQKVLDIVNYWILSSTFVKFIFRYRHLVMCLYLSVSLLLYQSVTRDFGDASSGKTLLVEEICTSISAK